MIEIIKSVHTWIEIICRTFFVYSSLLSTL